jgi:hypothetical protein
MKKRSQLHYCLLIEEERKKDVEKIKQYFKKYKPQKLKEEELE